MTPTGGNFDRSLTRGEVEGAKIIKLHMIRSVLILRENPEKILDHEYLNEQTKWVMDLKEHEHMESMDFSISTRRIINEG